MVVVAQHYHRPSESHLITTSIIITYCLVALFFFRILTLNRVGRTAKLNRKPDAEFHQACSVSDGATNTGKHTHKC